MSGAWHLPVTKGPPVHPEIPRNPGLPFAALTSDEERRLVDNLAFITIAKGHVIYTQEISRVTQIYIIVWGRLSYRFTRGTATLLSGTERKSFSLGIHR